MIIMATTPSPVPSQAAIADGSYSMERMRSSSLSKDLLSRAAVVGVDALLEPSGPCRNREAAVDDAALLCSNYDSLKQSITVDSIQEQQQQQQQQQQPAPETSPSNSEDTTVDTASSTRLLVTENMGYALDMMQTMESQHREPSPSATTSGLDLLGSLALTKPPASPSPTTTTTTTTCPAAKVVVAPGSLDKKKVREWVAQEAAAKMKKEERVYVDKIREWDVLCGRGGKSNHHAGNKRYRQVVSEMKNTYRNQDDKSAKTDLSRTIVDYVCSYGGRFLKKGSNSDRYYVLTRAEARKKTSQALRETKEPKWTL